jgi:hypothetical protein
MRVPQKVAPAALVSLLGAIAQSQEAPCGEDRGTKERG